MRVEDIAKVCHEANRAYCQTLGDVTQSPWQEAPDWQRKSAIEGVEFHLVNPDVTDASSHENWLKGKEAEGWKYGPEKNTEDKTHPCMVPFDQLPVSQQLKDRLFRSICCTFLG